MIKEIFIHNYKGFVNFRMDCGRIVFLMGGNGSGKTSLIEAIRGLAAVISEGNPASHFTAEQRNRFDDMEDQNFKLHVQLGDQLFRYSLNLGFEGRERRVVVLREEVTANGEELLWFENGVLRLTGHGAPFSFDWRNSALAIVQDDRLVQLKNWAAGFIALRLNPAQVQPESRKAALTLAANGSNFTAWYETMANADTQRWSAYLQSIREVIPGLEAINLVPLHQSGKLFQAGIMGQGEIGRFSLDELSDGQKSLIVLYAILHLSVRQGATIGLDEPDNYLALAEIEPFLYELENAVEKSHAQVFVISHHPEFYNRWARDAEKCRYFERTESGHFLVRLIDWEEHPGLSPAELIARGWQDE